LERNAAVSNVKTCPPLDLETFFSNRMPEREERMSVLPAAMFGAKEADALARCVLLFL